MTPNEVLVDMGEVRIFVFVYFFFLVSRNYDVFCQQSNRSLREINYLENMSSNIKIAVISTALLLVSTVRG